MWKRRCLVTVRNNQVAKETSWVARTINPRRNEVATKKKPTQGVSKVAGNFRWIVTTESAL